YLNAADPGAHGQHVGIVVLTAETRHHRVGGLDAADAADLVRDDGLAGPAAAEDDAEVVLTARDGAGHRRDEVRVVDRIERVRPEVAVLDPQLVEEGAEQTLQLESGVV